MNALLEHFITPGGEAPAAAPRPAPVQGAAGACAVVLGAAAEAGPVGRLLAAHLRLRQRAGCALLAEWRPGSVAPPRGGSAARPARTLAERLESRGLSAVARGRLVGLALAAEPEAAASEWQRATAAADCPTVGALGGPRPDAFRALLEAADLVLLVLGAAAPTELEALALDGLVEVRAPIVRCAPVPGGLASMLSSSSLGTARALGTAVTDAVRAL